MVYWEGNAEKNMIDIHCHIIYNVDDGAKNIEDSIRMVSEAARIGIQSIIATPHYNKSIYSSEGVLEKYTELKLKSKNLGIELFLGYEIFLCTSLSDIFSGKRKYTLNNSSYLLFELPFDIMPIGLSSIIQNLYYQGLTPIIAHPERNKYFLRDMDSFLALIASHCLVQLDAASIAGAHGLNVKRFSKKLIKKNLVNFVASDAHRPEDYSKWYQKAVDNVKNWAGEEYCRRVFGQNQRVILNDG